MKKSVKLLVTFIAAVSLLFTFALSASAMENDFSTLFDFASASQEAAQSIQNDGFDTSVENRIRDTAETFSDMYSEAREYTAKAISQQKSITDSFDIAAILIGLLIAVILGLHVAAIVYVIVSAPKCGMSRLWALVPIFSAFFGLLVIIYIHSRKKTSPQNGKAVICAVCGGVHPQNTAFCSICGNAL